MEILRRLSKTDCRQEKAGSCNGCPVQGIALARMDKADSSLLRVSLKDFLGERNEKGIVEETSRTLCPKGEIMQTPTRFLGTICERAADA